MCCYHVPDTHSVPRLLAVGACLCVFVWSVGPCGPSFLLGGSWLSPLPPVWSVPVERQWRLGWTGGQPRRGRRPGRQEGQLSGQLKGRRRPRRADADQLVMSRAWKQRGTTHERGEADETPNRAGGAACTTCTACSETARARARLNAGPRHRPPHRHLPVLTTGVLISRIPRGDAPPRAPRQANRPSEACAHMNICVRRSACERHRRRQGLRGP
jgi:hypothetical protein